MRTVFSQFCQIFLQHQLSCEAQLWGLCAWQPACLSSAAATMVSCLAGSKASLGATSLPCLPG